MKVNLLKRKCNPKISTVFFHPKKTKVILTSYYKSCIISFLFFTKMNIRKLANILTFYKSTIPINLAVSVLPLLYGGMPFFEAIFLTLGFITSLFVKEFTNKNEYLFYNNNGITKIQLFVLSYILNFFFLALIVILINLIMKLF